MLFLYIALMRILLSLVIILNLSFELLAQNAINTNLIATKPLTKEALIHVDKFGAKYTLNGGTLKKYFDGSSLNYNNFQLGNISQIDIFNPLKIPLFYSQFNTLIILDNRLAEIFKVDFNNLPPYRSITLVSSCIDNTVWIYNQNTQQLELFDYKTNKSRLTTIPLQGQALDIDSNYNDCWLLTQDYIYQFHYTGSIVNKTKNDGFDTLCQSMGNIFLKKGNRLFAIKKNEDEIRPITLPDLSIKQFFVIEETLYIYQEDTLKIYQLKLQ